MITILLKLLLLLQVYEEDLTEHPDNGFALHGLIQSLRDQSASANDLQQARTRLETAWQHADAPLPSACPAFAA